MWWVVANIHRIMIDALLVMVFVSYLLAVRRAPTGDATLASTIETA